jgi:hypothetical protein
MFDGTCRNSVVSGQHTLWGDMYMRTSFLFPVTFTRKIETYYIIKIHTRVNHKYSVFMRKWLSYRIAQKGKANTRKCKYLIVCGPKMCFVGEISDIDIAHIPLKTFLEIRLFQSKAWLPCQFLVQVIHFVIPISPNSSHIERMKKANWQIDQISSRKAVQISIDCISLTSKSYWNYLHN